MVQSDVVWCRVTWCGAEWSDIGVCSEVGIPMLRVDVLDELLWCSFHCQA